MPTADFATVVTANYALANNNVTAVSPVGPSTPNTVSTFTIATNASASGDQIDCEFVQAVVHATNAQLPNSFTEDEIQSVIDLAQSGVTNPGVSAWSSVNADGSINGALNCTVSRTNTPDGNTYPESTGFYYVTFDTPMPTADYSVSSSIAEIPLALAHLSTTRSRRVSGLMCGQGGTRYDQAFDHCRSHERTPTKRWNRC